MFTDEAEIDVASGSGGRGAVSFRREKYVPRGGPDGGDGGKGGDVYAVAKANLSTLSNAKMKRRFYAQDGRPGKGRNQHGAAGNDVAIELPPGTVLRDHASGEILADLTQVGQRVQILKGGRGGKGNAHFKSSRMRTPRFSQDGETGIELRVKLELQSIADVGLVGKPNAGKSTLLATLTSARPKIGDYPFTTLQPNLGVLRRGHEDLVVADIPGLVAGASQGAGLGHRFLRHVQRTSLLALVVPVDSADIVAELQSLQDELRQYSAGLVDRPQVVVLTKLDLALAPQPDYHDLVAAGLGLPHSAVVAVSAASHAGLDQLATMFFAEALAARQIAAEKQEHDR